MAITTGIEWCDSTLNLQMGCNGCELWNPGQGIKRCYAGNLTQLHGGPGKKGWPEAFEKPRIFPERLAQALKWPDLTGKERKDKPWLNGYPRTIFLNDMGDTFTESLAIDWLAPFVHQMALSPHVYIILTKRPRRMVKFWDAYLRPGSYPGAFDKIPPNFWLLTSVTGPENVGRIGELLQLRQLGARVLGVSYEPAWGPVDFWPYLPTAETRFSEQAWDYLPTGKRTNGLDWLITGGESGVGAQPSQPDWFRAARNDCQAVGVAYFFKQWGEYAPVIRFGGQSMARVGKKAAGALLDGAVRRQMPRI